MSQIYNKIVGREISKMRDQMAYPIMKPTLIKRKVGNEIKKSSGGKWSTREHKITLFYKAKMSI